jgi:hypothetical protein
MSTAPSLTTLLSGWRFALLALASPLDTFDTRLFAIHMAQHLLLLMVAPPLLLLGKPVRVLLLGLPRSLVHRVVRAHARTPWLHGITRRLASPLVAWALYVGDMLLWHVPARYQATLQNQGIHPAVNQRGGGGYPCVAAVALRPAGRPRDGADAHIPCGYPPRSPCHQSGWRPQSCRPSGETWRMSGSPPTSQVARTQRVLKRMAVPA